MNEETVQPRNRNIRKNGKSETKVHETNEAKLKRKHETTRTAHHAQIRNEYDTVPSFPEQKKNSVAFLALPPPQRQ